MDWTQYKFPKHPFVLQILCGNFLSLVWRGIWIHGKCQSTDILQNTFFCVYIIAFTLSDWPIYELWVSMNILPKLSLKNYHETLIWLSLKCKVFIMKLQFILSLFWVWRHHTDSWDHGLIVLQQWSIIYNAFNGKGTLNYLDWGRKTQWGSRE